MDPGVWFNEKKTEGKKSRDTALLSKIFFLKSKMHPLYCVVVQGVG
jgi:hypothetical protein